MHVIPQRERVVSVSCQRLFNLKDELLVQVAICLGVQVVRPAVCRTCTGVAGWCAARVACSWVLTYSVEHKCPRGVPVGLLEAFGSQPVPHPNAVYSHVRPVRRASHGLDPQYTVHSRRD